MVKPSNRRSSKRKKRLALSRGFMLSKSSNSRSMKQQLLHSAHTARIALKLKKRVHKKSHTKLLNFFLRTRGSYYGQFKTMQKRKAYGLNNQMTLDILIRKQDFLDMMLRLLKNLRKL